MLAGIILLVDILLSLGGRATYAQSRVGPSPSTTIDTRITLANWQNYQQFMSAGMVALFDGSHFWRVPQDFEVDVGPTISIPLPSRYLADTERYSDRVELTKTRQRRIRSRRLYSRGAVSASAGR
jgi:hypothetical protein